MLTKPPKTAASAVTLSVQERKKRKNQKIVFKKNCAILWEKFFKSKNLAQKTEFKTEKRG